MVRLAAGIVILVIIVGIVLLFRAVDTRGNQTRSNIRACHALGPRYHYWQERERCVRYLDA